MVKLYVNIKLPRELIEEVDKLIEVKALGYRSRGEFVAEATRTHLMKVKEFLKINSKLKRRNGGEFSIRAKDMKSSGFQRPGQFARIV